MSRLPESVGLHAGLERDLLTQIVAFMTVCDAQQDTLILHDGVRNLLHQPEFGDVELLQQVIEVVEEERMLAALISAADLDHGIQIMIGRESGMAELSRCSPGSHHLPRRGGASRHHRRAWLDPHGVCPGRTAGSLCRPAGRSCRRACFELSLGIVIG